MAKAHRLPRASALNDVDCWTQLAHKWLAQGSLPHYAPPREVLDHYAAALTALTASAPATTPRRVLVLGATPSLADLGLRHGLQVLRIDQCAAMFEAARMHEEVRDRSGEQKIEADWADLSSLRTGSIDAVIGDCALNNVRHAAMPDILRELARVLTPGGHYALRQVVRPEPPPQIAGLTALQRAGRLSLPAFRNAVRHGCFDDAAFDATTHVRDAAVVFAMVDAAHADGLLEDAEYAALRDTRSTLRLTTYVDSVQRALLEQWLGPCVVHVPRGVPAALALVRMYVGKRSQAA
jgi:SAM-dependent methyltransferase